MKANKNDLVIYSDQNGEIKIDVKVDQETVWLTQDQISQVFEKDRTVITKHIKNILQEEELDDSVCAIFAHTGSDDKVYQVKYYNLDMIISIGYRVNSKRGIQFRKWASKILKEYLIQGYSVNKERVLQDKLNHIRQTVELLSSTLINQNLVNETGQEVLELVRAYTKTWDMLIRYDEDNLSVPSNLQESDSGILTYEEAVDAISLFKQELTEGNSDLFGREREGAFKGILGSIDQTFGGIALYPSSEARSAHLLYFIIKDHPFSDGNKRIGSLLFLLYLKKAKIGLKNMSASSITSLALLIAESDPAQKELMIKLIINLISE